jgi:hypothetical protein
VESLTMEIVMQIFQMAQLAKQASLSQTVKNIHENDNGLVCHM